MQAVRYVAPDGRVFFTQQSDEVLIIKNGTLLTIPFLTLTNLDWSGERGLLGITLDPNFATNRYVYRYYAARTPVSHNRVSRCTANGDTVLANSELVLIDLPPNVPALWRQL